jgi:Holliday junction resolvase RusA-like endonuclease
MIDLTIRCVPPSVTAQMKRVRVLKGRPVFFHGAKMRREEQTWTALLQPHAPALPMTGPLALSIRMVWPHLKGVRKGDAHRILPKTTKPDCSNVSKHLEDLLVKLRFIENDAHVARHVIEKFHGPEFAVGIRIQIGPFETEE